jgi:hypothetical protein
VTGLVGTSVKGPIWGSDDAVRSATRSLRRRYSAARLRAGKGVPSLSKSVMGQAPLDNHGDSLKSRKNMHDGVQMCADATRSHRM